MEYVVSLYIIHNQYLNTIIYSMLTAGKYDCVIIFMLRFVNFHFLLSFYALII